MTPADFFHNVAAPNVEALASNVGDLRLAVNAILTLDALAGVIHADRHKQGLESANDSAFRSKLAAQHFEYQLLRDAAFALKHGELTGTRVVQRAEQVVAYSGARDDAAWDRSPWDTPALVWIEANNPAHSRPAYELARAVLGILQGI